MKRSTSSCLLTRGCFLLLIFIANVARASFQFPSYSIDEETVKNEDPVKYVLTYQKSWQLGTDLDFDLVLFEHPSYQLPVAFLAVLELAPDEKFRYTKVFTQTTYGLQKHTFNSKEFSEQIYKGSIVPTVTVKFDDPSGSLSLEDERIKRPSTELVVPKSDRFFFIQTDKSAYAPSDNVKIIVMGVDRHLKGLAGSVAVAIESPYRQPGHIWPEVVLNRGFDALNFTLPNEALEGEWKLHVSDLLTPDGREPDQGATRPFMVRKTVKPKLLVSIDFTSKFWLDFSNPEDEDGDYKGFIRARNLDGKPVAGKAVVMANGICGNPNDPRGSYGNSKQSPTLTVKPLTVELTGNALSADDGIFVLEGLTEALRKKKQSPADMFPFEECLIEVTVDFTEEATGEKATAVNSIQYYRHPFAIRIHKSTPKFVMPGLPFTVRVQVGHPGATTKDLPTDRDEPFHLRVVHFTDDSDHCADRKKLAESDTTDDEVDPDVIQSETFSFNVDEKGVGEVTIPVPKRAKTTVFYYSQPGDELCDSRPSSTESEDDDSISISMTSKDNEMPKVGEHVKFVSRTTSNSSFAYFMLISKGRALEYRNLDEPTEDEDYHGVTEFHFELALPAESAPRLTALVWTLSSDGKTIISDSVEFSVDVLEHQVSATFNPSEIDGDKKEVSLKIESNDLAGSTVAIFAVDKRARERKAFNLISPDDVLGQVSTTQTANYNPIPPAHWRCWDCDWHPKYKASSHKPSDVFESAATFIQSNVIGLERPSPAFDDWADVLSLMSLFEPSKWPIINNLPETWLSQILEISPNQTEVVAKFSVPDSETTWSLSAIAIGESKGFGALHRPVEVTVTKK